MLTTLTLINDGEMKNICSCENTILQQRFCDYDFVITGRKAGEIKRINMDLLGVRHGISIVPIAVNHVVRGPIEVNTIVNLFYVVDSSCGVDSNSIPKNDESYLITGYRYKRRSTGARKGKEPFFVTACSDSMKLNTLTITQIGGVFSQLYCLREYKPITKDFCSFPLYAASCFSKYRICLDTNNTAEWNSILYLRDMEDIPKELHNFVQNQIVERVNEARLHNQCVRNLRKHR
ncbi:unnamed protein product [Hymenolepis diminuta]|uniref:Uncharacterized protein n=1 Tax=Hymenolepis diminuta TaxID=6216 RepID=A0A0R3SMG7_HYMDI|nr:unnamed protein product [Hymenolepis diminuta]VUZ49992.1 unnamed protein product [Hymenolepis diminuta]